MPGKKTRSTNSAPLIRYQGFTLIELLIVIVTMILVFTVGFANFRGTQQRQELQNAVLYIKTDLRLVQELALSNRIKPVGCDILKGYKLKYVNTTTYKIYANCNSGGGTTDIQIDTNQIDLKKKFPSITLSNFGEVNFHTLGRGVENTVVITVTSSSAGTQTITINKGGEIN